MKKFLSIILAALMVLASVSICLADDIKFSDVDSETETGKSIYKLVGDGVVNGYEDGTFRPNAFLTRAELCKMVNLIFGFKTAGENVFTDVKADDWYYDYVLTAVKEGYIIGHGDGTFGGDDNLTREQVCVILGRLVKDTADTSKVMISDEVSDWALEAVKKSIALGYFQTEENGTFRATADITRAELAVVCAKLVKEPETENNTAGNDKNTSISGSGSSRPSSGGSSSGGGSSSNKDDSKADEEKAEEVIKKIDAIGEVTEESKTLIEDAEKAYDALTDKQKKLVTNYSTLTDARAAYDKIEAELSAKICANLKKVLEDVEPIEFNGKAAEVMEVITKDIQDALDAADKGTIITNEYVRTTYADDIADVKEVINGMSDEEKEAFKKEILKINTASLMYITKYFDINMDALG